MSILNKNPETIMTRLEKQKYCPERTLLAAIIRQAWEDSFHRSWNAYKDNKTHRQTETELARKFLTGNYSREMFYFCCTELGIDPNYLIKIAMTCSWAKNIKPIYFRS